MMTLSLTLAELFLVFGLFLISPRRSAANKLRFSIWRSLHGKETHKARAYRLRFYLKLIFLLLKRGPIYNKEFKLLTECVKALLCMLRL